ncbi:MAG: chemotaxis protein CheX [Planctomycetota bacterium]
MTAVAAAPTAAPASPSLPVAVNEDLCNAVVAATRKGLAMCGVEATCVGVSRVPARQAGAITGMIGVHGKVSGFVTVNLSECLALQAVGGLLGESFEKLSPQVVDGAGELTNLIVGGVKSVLSTSHWAFGQITIPSVIVGDGYQVAFADGLELIDVLFEVENENAIGVSDRMLHVTLSLLRL